MLEKDKRNNLDPKKREQSEGSRLISKQHSTRNHDEILDESTILTILSKLQKPGKHTVKSEELMNSTILNRNKIDERRSCVSLLEKVLNLSFANY